MQLVNVFLLLAFNAVHAKKCANKTTLAPIATTSVSSAKSSEVPSTLAPSTASTAPLTSKAASSSSSSSSSSSAVPATSAPPTTQKPTSSSSSILPSSSSSSAAPIPTTTVGATTQKPLTSSSSSSSASTQKPTTTSSFVMPVPSNNLVATPDPLDCKPLNIVDETNYKYLLECRLGQQPNSTTTLFVNGSGLKFDSCGFTFSPSNWNVYQSSNVYAVPDTAGTNLVRNLNLTAKTFGTGVYNNKQFTLPYTRKARKPVTCGFSGDPHFSPFAANATAPYSFQGLGPYTIIDSALGLRVIANYYKCGGSVACTGGISIQYHNAHFVVSTETKVQSSVLHVMSLSNNTAGTTYTVAADSKRVTFAFEDGSSMAVSVGWSNSLSFSAVLAPIYYKGVKGHCNVYDETIPAKTLYANNTAYSTSSQTSINAFGNFFKVLTPDNCFLGNCTKPAGIKTLSNVIPAACPIPSSNKTVTFQSVPIAPKTFKPCDFVYANCTTSPTIVKRDVVPAEDLADKPCDLTYDDAEDMCIQAIDTINCDSLVQVMPFVQACVLDSMAVCGYSFIADHKNAYAASCKAQTDLMLENSDDSVVAKGQAMQAKNGFGATTCPEQCNGNGDCTELGCSCLPGFTGAACDVNLKELDINANANTILLSNGQKLN